MAPSKTSVARFYGQKTKKVNEYLINEYLISSVKTLFLLGKTVKNLKKHYFLLFLTIFSNESEWKLVGIDPTDLPELSKSKFQENF